MASAADSLCDLPAKGFGSRRDCRIRLSKLAFHGFRCGGWRINLVSPVCAGQQLGFKICVAQGIHRKLYQSLIVAMTNHSNHSRGSKNITRVLVL